VDFLQRQKHKAEDISRFFTTLSASGNQYYTVPAVTLTGDYKISALVYFSDSIIGITGRSDSFSGRARVTADGGFDVRFDNASAGAVLTSGGLVPSNRLSILTIERAGSTGIIEVNNVEVFSGAVPTGQLTINSLARSSSTYSEGVLANVKIYDASTLSRQYKINEDWTGPSTVLVDSSGNSQNGTAVNITDADASLFDQVIDGWTGVELKRNFVTGLSGTAAASTYNTLSGEGACTRVDSSNLSFIQISGLISSSLYRFKITNTGSVVLSIRQNFSSTTIATVNVSDSLELDVSTELHQDLRVQCGTGNGEFTINLLKQFLEVV
jgi:hypothetical protein